MRSLPSRNNRGVMIVSSRLELIRIQAGLSETELARAMGVSRTTIYKVEAGQMNPSLPTLTKWVEACGFELGIFPADAGLARALSSMAPADQALVHGLIGILPHLTADQREMYAAIFAGLAARFNA